jgi:hypothetical protein
MNSRVTALCVLAVFAGTFAASTAVPAVSAASFYNQQIGVGNINIQAGEDVTSKNEKCENCGLGSANRNDLLADRGGGINLGE